MSGGYLLAARIPHHAPLRSAHNKMRSALPRSESINDCLQYAVKCVNDTVGPEGLCPTLLVYGSMPRLSKRVPAETQVSRARAMNAAMEKVQEVQAKRKISFALRHPSSNQAQQQEEDLQKLPAGSPVLVYREGTKKWEGPFPFISVDKVVAAVQLPSGRKLYRTSVVKSFLSLKDENLRGESDEKTSSNINYYCENDHHFAFYGAQDAITKAPDHVNNFTESRKREVEGLLARNVLEVVKRSTVPKGMRIYGTRFVDVVKTVNGKTIEKSRLVAQNYRDKAATEISTKSPTISRMGIRMVLATGSLFEEHRPYTRDISQAYVQSKYKLERLVYLRAPKEMGLRDDEVLRARKPLYGIPESGLYWFVTYQQHYVDKLGMQAGTVDKCLLHRMVDGVCGVTVVKESARYRAVSGTEQHTPTQPQRRSASVRICYPFGAAVSRGARRRDGSEGRPVRNRRTRRLVRLAARTSRWRTYSGAIHGV